MKIDWYHHSTIKSQFCAQRLTEMQREAGLWGQDWTGATKNGKAFPLHPCVYENNRERCSMYARPVVGCVMTSQQQTEIAEDTT